MERITKRLVKTVGDETAIIDDRLYAEILDKSFFYDPLKGAVERNSSSSLLSSNFVNRLRIEERREKKIFRRKKGLKNG